MKSNREFKGRVGYKRLSNAGEVKEGWKLGNMEIYYYLVTFAAIISG